MNPTEFHPGETKEVVLTVKNNGGDDARDIRLEFQVEDKGPVSLVGPTVAQINTLNSWCSKEVKITVHVEEGTPNGVYSIPIICSCHVGNLKVNETGDAILEFDVDKDAAKKIYQQSLEIRCVELAQ